MADKSVQREQRARRNQSKWDSLQDEGQSHIDRILSGTSTEADLTALSLLLSQQHDLAGQIFDQGVEDAITTANTIVKQADEKRQAQGKRALTDKAQDRLFESTLRQVMASSIDDILGQVHDEFETHSQAVQDKVNDALERIRDFKPQTPRAPAPGEVTVTPEQRSLLDRLTGRGRPQSADDPHRSLMDRVFNRRSPEDRQRSSVMQIIKDTAVSAKDKITSLYDRVRSRDDGDEEKRASIWLRKLRGMFDPFKRGGRVREGAGKVASLLGKIGVPLMAALMNPKLLESISDAVQKHLSFDQISKYVTDMWEEAKGLGSTALDAVVDKVKAFFGVKEKKPKPVAKPAAAKTVTGELPRAITPAAAAAEIPRRQAQLEQARTKLAQAKAVYARSPTEANKRSLDAAQNTYNLLSMRVTQFKARAGEAPPEVSKETATLAVSPTPAGEVPNTVSPSSANVSTQQTSPVTPSVVRDLSSVNPQSTEVVGENPRLTPGKAVDPEPKQTEEARIAASKAGAIAQIGMGSFGFDSGDSAMNILNLGMLS